MNTTMPWSLRGPSDAARRAGAADGRNALAGSLDGSDPTPDHAADMAAIAAELSRLQGTGDGGRPTPRRSSADLGTRGPIRDAVAEIAKRQADLDGHGGAPGDAGRSAAPATASSEPNGTLPFTPARPDTAIPPSSLVGPGSRRPAGDLSAEVAQTFARFSQELHTAIRDTDARPKVEELGRQVTRLGQAVEDLVKPESHARSVASAPADGSERSDTRSVTAPPETTRAVPFDAVERQVAALEARLGRLATLPATAVAPPPDLGETLGEVRRLLEGLDPRPGMTSLESRLDDITARLSRGFDDENPAGLIENLGRRVDEIHASLRSQLAEAAVDTRPLEGLVRGLSDRLGQARAASADFEQLETAMRDVAARIETAGSDPRAIQAIEAQFTRLAERLDRSENSLKALDGVEQALGELFSQFEVTRQVAIDAAETAARTAARDTLRAALQNPVLAQRAVEAGPGLAEQVSRGLDDLRALQQSSELRTQSTLSDMRSLLERLVQGHPDAGPALRAPMPADEPRRRRPVVDSTPPAVVDPADLLIEPGLGRGHQGRSEPRFGSEPVVDAVPAAAPADPEGPAGFIAAARRAAQAAQASAASAAALKDADRTSPGRAATTRRRRVETEPGAAAKAGGALVRTKEFLARRRRPILLGLAAIVLLVGALEVAKLGLVSSERSRVEISETPASTRTAALDTTMAGAKATAPVAEAVLPPAAAPSPPPLPTFVAGATKAPTPVDGIGEGLRTLAASGDAGAQYEIGLRYAEGRGVARDPRQALAWFDKAAAQGLAPAQYRVGSSYEKGVGVDRDPALAMSWYAKAAGAGNIRAMHNLAVMSAEGAGGKPDYAKAAQWFGKASTYGVRDSQFNLAILYARGLGIEQSLVQSYKWFAIAAAQGDEDSAKKRDEVAAKLDPAALAAAKASVEAFRVTTATPAANEVTPPAGGWDAAAPRPAASAGAKVSQL